VGVTSVYSNTHIGAIVFCTQDVNRSIFPISILIQQRRNECNYKLSLFYDYRTKTIYYKDYIIKPLPSCNVDIVFNAGSNIHTLLNSKVIR